MSWEAVQTSQLVFTSDTEQFFALEPTLEPTEHAHVVFARTPATDTLLVRVYATLDGVAFDSEPFYEFRNTDGVADPQLSFELADVWGFRVGIQKFVTSATEVTADLSVRIGRGGR